MTDEAPKDQQVRATTRREVSVPCIATEQKGFQLLGQSVVDLSPWGMRLRSQVPVETGQQVRITFRVPGTPSRWMQAEGVVARVERGLRRTDAGYAVGVRFTELKPADRALLTRRLEGLPPVIPRRPVRVEPTRNRPD